MKITLLTLGLAVLIASCGPTKTEEKAETKAEPIAKVEKTAAVEEQNGNALTPVLDAYLAVKDALVNDNQEGAAKAGGTLATALGSLDLSTFDSDKQAELKEIVEVAKNHGEHISESEIAHQREHFEALSKDIKDLAGIVGTDRTLYHQYCPMYNGNKGGMWLSANEEVRNPLFGSSMLKCGKVEEVIKL
ncbi:DUF3347 domain-containing protein [Ekhidna sp.]|uniref:DUF3347 domain-containing protein n=1 Tax=Ekhidna sp. TaxID=2608089 RepID=UPI003513DAC1